MSKERHFDCESVRFALIQRADGPHDDAALDAHVVGCAVCRRELARAELRAKLVRSLPRAQAPTALDGIVVAALQAGARQARAARAVEDLSTLTAPDELARRIPGLVAPAVLDRLVGEDLADPSMTFARRYVGRLQRLRAPTELEGRLRRNARRTSPLLGAGILGGAGVLLVAAVLIFTYVGREDTTTRSSGPELVIERVESIRDLDPAAGLLLSGLTGGFVDAQRLAQEDS